MLKFLNLFLILKVIVITIIVINLFLYVLGVVGVRINFSPSMKQGIYFVVRKNLEKGDLVVICEEKARIFLKKKDSVCGYEELLKRVVAIPGDEVSIDKKGIWVNNKFIENSLKVNFNISNDLFTNILLNNYKLKKGEYLVLGDSEYSWDSRYFGVIEDKNIKEIVEFIF